MKNLKKFICVALTGALALALLFGNMAFPTVVEATATPLPPIIQMTDVIPNTSTTTQEQNSGNYQGVWHGGGWSGGTDGIHMSVVDEYGNHWSLPTLSAFLATNERASKNSLASAIEEVFGFGHMDLSTYSIANLEISDFHSDVAREIILLARYSIVFGDTAWTVNGQMEIVNYDGTVVILPEFNDVFPDWDLNEIIAVQNTSLAQLDAISGEVAATSEIAALNVIFYQIINIPLVQSHVQAPEFQHFHNNTGFIANLMVRVEQINFGGPTVNIDANCSMSGLSLGWAPALMAGQSARINNIPNGMFIGLRASMTQTAGTARISVTRI